MSIRNEKQHNSKSLAVETVIAELEMVEMLHIYGDPTLSRLLETSHTL